MAAQASEKLEKLDREYLILLFFAYPGISFLSSVFACVARLVASDKIPMLTIFLFVQ